MAVIKCTMQKGGKLKVVKVTQFHPGDIIQLDKPLEVSWHIDNNPKPIIRAFKCMAVSKAFTERDRVIEYIIPVPCPH